MLAAEDLVVQALIAIVVAKVEADLRVEVLHNKFVAETAIARAHGLELSGLVVAREHTAGIVAGIVHEAAGDFSIRPRVAAGVAVGSDMLGAEGEGTRDGGEESRGLHLESRSNV